MDQISMQDLNLLLPSLTSRELILDVRSAEEYAAGHLEGSRNLPYDEVGQHASELKDFEKVYIHCHAGRRAQIAVQVLQRLGLNNLVCIAYSGMQDWLDAGYKIVK